MLFRKHISGKWIALFLPVWGYNPAGLEDQIKSLDILALIQYNADLKSKFTNRENV